MRVGVRSRGHVRTRGRPVNLRGDLLFGGYEIPATNLTNTTARCYAVYLGRAPVDCFTIGATVQLGTTAAVDVVYAELAVMTGAYAPTILAVDGAPTLTTLGWASIATEVAGGASRIIHKTITPTRPIRAGTELWAAVSASVTTTQPVWRTTQSADVHSRTAYKNTTRPSTMAAATAFVGNDTDSGIQTPSMSLIVP